MSNIIIIGSANMDTSCYLEGDFPEVLTAEGLNQVEKTETVLGGKGFNQAVSAKKQSSQDDRISFIGCIGEDKQGVSIIEKLKEMRIDYSGVKVLKDKKTDGRIIFVDKNGNNRMIGYGDCVKELKPSVFEDENIQKKISEADFIMIQMKMPEETVEYLIDYCEKNGKTLLIDPTPPEKSSLLLRKGLLDKASFLTPNEEEAYALSKYEEGFSFEEIKGMFKKENKVQILESIRRLIKNHPNIVATLGENGVMYNNNGIVNVKNAYKTKCIDSTGAGDTFNGAFITAIARGENLNEAVKCAQMSSSIKVQFAGAQNGMPTLDETINAINAIERG